MLAGHLFSVNPSVMRSVEGLFNFNERVILHGHWKHGSLLMAAVGAYNVGSVHLEFAVEKVYLVTFALIYCFKMFVRLVISFLRYNTTVLKTSVPFLFLENIS